MSKWRTGRKLGRTLYEMQGADPSDHDMFLGLMETRYLAELVVRDHNNRIDVRPVPSEHGDNE